MSRVRLAWLRSLFEDGWRRLPMKESVGYGDESFVVCGGVMNDLVTHDS
jgi:hypothetical protein